MTFRRGGPGRRPGAPLLGRRHQTTFRYGGAVLPLPLVATVGVTNITATSASLVGSVNPQGLGGVCWFAYGTTPAFGNTTPTQSIGALTTPSTLTAQVSALTTGTMYWFAMVCETLAGTVTSAPLTFTAQAQPVVTDPSTPLISSATPAVSVPRVAWPMVITNDGAVVVEQDSFEDTLTQVQVVAACQIGQCPELPTFGIPDLTFLPGPPDTTSLVTAIQQWAPSAEESTVVQALDNSGGVWGVALNTTITGTGQ